jgi:ubiquinone/menaquinone biosynthesis C-methylase UbiE
LAQAETSPSGISFFFPDQPEYEAFADVVALPEAARRDANEVAQRYDLVPRRWVKVHSRGGGFSQYHVINAASNSYPITTLRQVVRRYRQGEAGPLEAGLKPALERSDSTFAFILKNGLLRLSFRIPRELLSNSLTALTEAGLLTESLARAHRLHDPEMGPSPGVYLTFQPGDPDVLSVDYERPWGHTKCRFSQGQLELSDYRSLPETLSEEQLAALCRYDCDDDQVRAYFDDIDQATSQLGQLKHGLPETYLDLARRAGIEPGMKVLDAGCGLGDWALRVAREISDVEVQGLTLSAREVGRARERGVNAVAGDFHDLPFPGDTFDRVVFLESFWYAREPARVLAEAYRVLKPGGRIFIKDLFCRTGPLKPAERLELAEFHRVHHALPATLDSLLARTEFQVQTLELYSLKFRKTFRRYLALPVSSHALLSAPRA